MNRAQLEHIIRAAGDLLGVDRIVIVGSQAILASFPDNELPGVVTLSMEADVLPIDDPDGTQADLVDGVLGELSRFHETHGIYADGVSPVTVTLPGGWRDRLIAYRNANTNGVTGLCLEAHDLCVAKLVAGRTKDWEFVRSLVGVGKIDPVTLSERVGRTQVPVYALANIHAFLDGLDSQQG